MGDLDGFADLGVPYRIDTPASRKAQKAKAARAKKPWADPVIVPIKKKA